MRRIERRQDRRLARDSAAESGDRDEPDDHDRAENHPDSGCASCWIENSPSTRRR